MKRFNYKALSLLIGSMLSSIQAMETHPERNIVPERYIIKNRALGVDRDPSGYYAQFLNDKPNHYYSTDKDKYLPQGFYRNSIVLEISQVEDGAYTLKNYGLEGGLLTWVNERTYNEYYAQVLKGSHYDQCRNAYLEEGQYRNSMLWELSKVESPNSLQPSNDSPESLSINPQRFAIAVQQEEERQHDLANYNYNLAFENQNDKDFLSRFNHAGLFISNTPLNRVDPPQEEYIIDGIQFKRQNVSGRSMRCFFNAIGLEPVLEIRKLKRKCDNPIVQNMIANEIVSAAATPDQLPKEVKTAIGYMRYEADRSLLDDLEKERSEMLAGQSPDPNNQNINLLPPSLQNIAQQGEEILNELRKKASSPEALNAFLKYHIDNEQMMVVLHDVQGDAKGNTNANYTSIDAVAYINSLALKIYQPGIEGLRLAHEYTPLEATKVAYLYHQGIHFQALVPSSIVRD